MMNWWENLKLAAESLWANRLRSLLTMLGLIIGISSVILVIALGVGAQRFVKEQFQDLGSNVIALFDEGPRIEGRQPLTLADAEAIRTGVATVKNVAPIAYGDGRVVWGSRDAQAQINGTPPSLAELLKINYIKGRYFTRAEISERSRVVILGESLSKRLFNYEDPIGKTVILNSQPLIVIGVTRRGFFESWVDLDRGLMVPLPLAMESMIESDSPFGKKVAGILIEGKPNTTVEEVTFDVKNLMRLRHHITDKEDFIIGNIQEILDIFNNVALGVTILLGVTAAISLLVSGIGIANVMLVSVTERTREIGLRKALGASEEVILTQFLTEAVLLSSVGGLFGVLLGIIGAVAIGQVSPIKPEITVGSILLAVGVSVGAGISFGVFPAQRAANLDPIVALRSD
jgi:putative ABC transport system permease protein